MINFPVFWKSEPTTWYKYIPLETEAGNFTELSFPFSTEAVKIILPVKSITFNVVDSETASTLIVRS